MMHTKITGIGRYLPEKILTNADLEKMVDTSDEWITNMTGIKERHVTAENEYTRDMSTKAALMAIEDAGLTPEDIDLIILSTITADFKTPATACLVQSDIGAKNAACFDISAACSGFIYGLTIADGLIRTGSYKNALVIGAETLTKVTDWTDRNTCVLFGDGAGAAVLSASEENGLLSTFMASDGVSGKYITLPGLAFPDWDQSQRAGQDRNTLYMNGHEVYRFAVKAMVEATHKAVEAAGLTMDDIDHVIPHQANERIIDGATRRLKVPPEKVYKNIARHGNISAACIPSAICEMAESGLLKKGDKIAIVAMGSGLTWAAAVIEWQK